MRFVAVVFVVLFLQGCPANERLRSQFADPLPPETSAVAATWFQGDHFLPANVLKSGTAAHHQLLASRPGWADRVAAELLAEGTRLPAVIFLHGCTGFHGGVRLLVNHFLDEGFAVFAPNSFARPGRRELCTDAGVTMRERIDLRREELVNASGELARIPWIDNTRLVLAGFSEGAQAAASWSGGGFVAHVLLGTDCRFASGVSRAPAGIPVLNIVGSRDEWGYGGGCDLSGRRAAGTRRVIVRGADHDLLGVDQPRIEIARFLGICCSATTVERAGTSR